MRIPDSFLLDAAGKMVKYFALHTILSDALEQAELAAIADIECKDDEHDEAITNLRELMKCALTILNDKGTLLELDLKPQDFMPFSKANATLQLAATDFSIGDFDTCKEKLIELQSLIEDLKALTAGKKVHKDPLTTDEGTSSIPPDDMTPTEKRANDAETGEDGDDG